MPCQSYGQQMAEPELSDVPPSPHDPAALLKPPPSQASLSSGEPPWGLLAFPRGEQRRLPKAQALANTRYPGKDFSFW